MRQAMFVLWWCLNSIKFFLWNIDFIESEISRIMWALIDNEKEISTYVRRGMEVTKNKRIRRTRGICDWCSALIKGIEV